MVSVAVVIAWYLSGFLIASWMVDRGHSPVVWWSIAALLGGMTAAPAAVARATHRRSRPRLDVVSVPDAHGNGVRLMIVGPADRLDGVLDAVPPAVAGRTGAVTVVGLVGHEAFCAGVDTGERAVAADVVRDAVRPHARTDARIVTTEGFGRVDSVIAQAGLPDLLVADARRRAGALRRSLRTYLEVSARHDVPILFAPRGAGDVALPSAAQPHVDVVA